MDNTYLKPIAYSYTSLSMKKSKSTKLTHFTQTGKVRKLGKGKLITTRIYCNAYPDLGVNVKADQ